MYTIEANAGRGGATIPGEHLFLEHQHLKDESFSGLKLASFDALGCTFERCDFRKLKAPHVVLAAGKEASRYVECTFDGTRFRKLLLGPARLERCRFLDVKITDLFSHSAEFVDCVFSGTISGAAFYGTVVGMDAEFTSRRLNEFRGNDFSAMKFSDVTFRQGVDLRLQKLPAGDDYFLLEGAEAKLAVVRRRHVEQPASEARKSILTYLDVLIEEAAGGQADLFLCRDSAPYLSDRIIRDLWKELANTRP